MASSEVRRRTINLVFLAHDPAKPLNDYVIAGLKTRLPQREEWMRDPLEYRDQIKDETLPVFKIKEMKYEEFMDESETSAETTLSSVMMSVVIMTEMGEASLMNAVYKHAKQRGMRVILALPPSADHWCAMVDPTGQVTDSDITLINEHLMRKIQSNTCKVSGMKLAFWIFKTLFSLHSSVASSSIRDLLVKHDLMRPHWCFSGIPFDGTGFLDHCLCIALETAWPIKNCSMKGMGIALFTAKNELLLIRQRTNTSRFIQIGTLFRVAEKFEVIDLSESPMKCDIVSNDKIHCTVGEVSFDVIRNEDGEIPLKWHNRDGFEIEEVEKLLLDSMEEVMMDETLQCLVKSAVNYGRFTHFGKELKPGQLPRVDVTASWFRILRYLVSHSVDYELSFLPRLLSICKERVNWMEAGYTWIYLLRQPVFSKVSQKSHLFRRCLFASGLADPRVRHEALNFAIEKGDSKMIEIVDTFIKGLRSQSTMEEEMAEGYARWAAQNEYFVKEYLMREEGGKGALKALSDSLAKFIRDRGDFTAVNLMGIVWHSDDETKRAVLERLMLSVKNTLDYNTVHSDKCGWMWIKESVLKHPVWLSEQVAEKPPDSAVIKPEEKTEEPEKKTRGFLRKWLRKSKAPSESAEIGKYSEGKHVEESTKVESEPTGTMFALIKEHCDKEAEEKGGNDIQNEMEKMCAADLDSWKELCGYQPSIKASMQVRQDSVGRKSDLSSEEIRQIGLSLDTADFNAEKEYDSKAYLTGVLMDAHFVQPHFESLMKSALSEFGRVQIAPVKKASRILPKSEEYASEGRKWPHSACVIDLVRCSVTVRSLSELVAALKGFESYLAEHSEVLSLVRCKNGFAKFHETGSVPDHYCDVKMNVACKDESGTRCVIGEVQFLLDCILKSKKKGHELYEVSRMMPLFEGAKQRLITDWSVQKMLVLSVDNDTRLTRLLTFFPFQLNLQNHDIYLLFKSKWNDPHLIDAVADAIVEKSGVKDLSLISSSISDSLNTDQPFRHGICRLMCAIIMKAGGSQSLCVRFLQSMIDSFSGVKVLIPAMIGIDESIKKEVIIGTKITDGPHSYESYKDTSAMDIASFVQGWHESSDFDSGYFVRLLFSWVLYSNRSQSNDKDDTIDSDPTLFPALRSLFHFHPKRFLNAVQYFYKSDWNQKLPDYMMDFLRDCQDISPEIIQAFLERMFITEAELTNGY